MGAGAAAAREPKPDSAFPRPAAVPGAAAHRRHAVRRSRRSHQLPVHVDVRDRRRPLRQPGRGRGPAAEHRAGRHAHPGARRLRRQGQHLVHSGRVHRAGQSRRGDRDRAGSHDDGQPAGTRRARPGRWAGSPPVGQWHLHRPGAAWRAAAQDCGVQARLVGGRAVGCARLRGGAPDLPDRLHPQPALRQRGVRRVPGAGLVRGGSGHRQRPAWRRHRGRPRAARERPDQAA